MTKKRMTCVFDYDVREFAGNPHHADTPFGCPVIVSDGDLAAEMGWQPIETAPEGETILAARGHVMFVTNYCMELDGQKWWNFGRGSRWQPTHWMPLPASPPAKQEAAE